MGERTYCLKLSYDGTRFHGWQRLPNAVTVQGRLEAALSDLFDRPIEVDGSGRTDAGVHASAQYVSFRAPEAEPARILAKLRHRLPEDIGALALCHAPERFHARLSATQKTYTYRVWNAETPDVFGRRFRVQMPQELDLAAMRHAAELCLGTHDFLAFCSNKHFKKSSVRTLHRFDIAQNGAELTFTLSADGFLYNMVRILVGTVLEVGLGERREDSIPALFERRIRAEAGQTAPAKGLCLTEVRYEHPDFREIEML